MKNLHQESPSKNNQNGSVGILYAPDTQTPILNPASQREVSPKIEIKLGRKQLNETQWLFTQYGLKKPTWLRGKFLLNQYRRKCLNDNLREAQLDKAYCFKCTCADDWSSLLHSLWHEINKVDKCL